MTFQKTIRVLLILCCIAVSRSIHLFAQTVVSYPIVIGPVTQAPEYQADAANFYEDIVIELKYQGSIQDSFTVRETARLPAVPTMGTLSTADQAVMPHYAVTMHLSRNEEKKNTFTLRVWDLAITAYPVTEYTMPYDDPQEIQSFMPYSVWQIASVLPVNTYSEGSTAENTAGDEGQDEDTSWKTSWFYLGLQAGVSARLYATGGNSQSISTVFTPAFRAEFQAAAFKSSSSYVTFSLQTVISISQDKALFQKYQKADGDEFSIITSPVEYSSYSLTLPLVFKISFKPGRFMLGPYAGAYFILPLGDSAPYSSLPLGLSLGLELGVHAGPGIAFLDFGYSADMGDSVFKGEGEVPCGRNSVTISIGYSFGILQRYR